VVFVPSYNGIYCLSGILVVFAQAGQQDSLISPDPAAHSNGIPIFFISSPPLLVNNGTQNCKPFHLTSRQVM